MKEVDPKVSNIKDVLKRLDKLTWAEARMVTPQVLKATHNVDDRVKEVTDKVVSVDDGVASADGRVKAVDDEVTALIDGAHTY